MNKLAVVILAAGQGTRMKSDKAKVLHPILGRPMVDYALDVADALKPERTVVVVGVQAQQVKEALKTRGPRFALQKQQLGTGHAVMAALPALRGFSGDVVVFYGDGPCLRAETLQGLVQMHRRRQAALTLLTVDLPEPRGYGRIIRDAKGKVQAIVEEKDCTPEQRLLQESNPGLYCYRLDFLKKGLPQIRNANRQKEYYLTDLVQIAVDSGQKVESAKVADLDELVGVNSRWELARAESILSARINRAHGEAGVSIEAPETVYIEPGVKIARDARIERGARLLGDTVIGEGVVIESGARVRDTVIGAHSVIEMNSRVSCSEIGSRVRIKTGSVIEDSKVSDRAMIGPMAHLRPGSVIGAGAKLGNYVETKKALIGDDTKISHLTYVGDAEIGKRVNLACGFITCNYDGVNKYKTVVEDDVFVGSDCQAVAPVRIGKGAYIGSGTTITADVPPGALTLARTPQLNKEGWVAKKARQRKAEARRKKTSGKGKRK